MNGNFIIPSSAPALVIEDHTAMAFVLQHQLEAIGFHHFVVCLTLQEAQERLSQETCLLVTDYLLHGDTADSLIERALGYDIPILLVSGSVRAYKYRNLPNPLFLSKPYTMNQLEKSLRQALSIRQPSPGS